MALPPADLTLYHCAIAPIAAAVTFDGAGEHGRIKIDLPRSESDALRLVQKHWTARPFLVTIPLPAADLVVTFEASLPETRSALAFDGAGDGGRLTLDVEANGTDALLILQRHATGLTFTATLRPVSE